MDYPVNTFLVREEHEGFMVKFLNKKLAEEYEKKYGAVVVKEQGKDIWYVVPKGAKQITWMENE